MTLSPMFCQSIVFAEAPIYRRLRANGSLWTWQLFLMEAVVKYKGSSAERRCKDNRGVISDPCVGFRHRLRFPQSFMLSVGAYTML